MSSSSSCFFPFAFWCIVAPPRASVAAGEFTHHAAPSFSLRVMWWSSRHLDFFCTAKLSALVRSSAVPCGRHRRALAVAGARRQVASFRRVKGVRALCMLSFVSQPDWLLALFVRPDPRVAGSIPLRCGIKTPIFGVSPATDTWAPWTHLSVAWYSAAPDGPSPCAGSVWLSFLFCLIAENCV